MYSIPQFLTIRQNQLTTELFLKLGAPFKRDESGEEKVYKNRLQIINRPGQAKVGDLLLLVAIMAEYSESNSFQLIIPLNWYYSLRGISDKKYMRSQILSGLDYLSKVEFSKYEARKNIWTNIKIFEEAPKIERGAIRVSLSPDMRKLLPREKVMRLPTEVFHLEKGEKTCTRLLLVWKIYQHERINHFEKMVFALSVQTLLAVCSDLPDYDTVAKYRHVQRDIIDPFESALSRCNSLFKWEYESINYNSGLSQKRGWLDFFTDLINITPRILSSKGELPATKGGVTRRK